MSADGEGISILELAETVLRQTQDVTKYLQANDLAAPTFSPKSSEWPTTPEFMALQTNLQTSIYNLQRLVDGPARFIHSSFTQGSFMAGFQIALDFDFFTLVPAEGEVSLKTLAKKAGLDEDRTSRVMRMLIAHGIFQETKPNHISHNHLSIALFDEEQRAIVHMCFDELLKAASESAASAKASPDEADSAHCPASQRFGIPIFEYYLQNPDKDSRLANAMAGLRKTVHSIDGLRDGFPWTQIDGTVVDIGGGNGHISMTLARLFPKLHFVVQDHSDRPLAQGQGLLTDDIRDRISFSKHDYFEAQPCRDMAAFILRQCLHSWGDREAVKMLKAIVPGLENSAPGTPLLINEVIMSEPGVQPRLKEQEQRRMDMLMMVVCGGKERTVAQYEILLKEADPRYEISRVYDVGALGLIEVHLR